MNCVKISNWYSGRKMPDLHILHPAFGKSKASPRLTVKKTKSLLQSSLIHLGIQNLCIFSTCSGRILYEFETSQSGKKDGAESTQFDICSPF